MCLSPITIFPKSLYFRPAVSSSSIEVPCGSCAACRDSRKVAWEDRLCLEVFDWYKNGGIGLMLTFTYNDLFLPRYTTKDEVVVPCFSSSDVKQFLNRLKVRCNREFCQGFYKYFLCSEYGKTTQRPHLHGTFLIKDESKYVQFVEICRECWSLTFETDCKGHKRLVHRLGYMFPKRVNGRYVDDKGRDRDPRFRSQLAGAKYVCKYVCKDLDYLGDSRVIEAMRENSFRYYLPKSFKSNNLGFAPIKRIVESADSLKIQNMLKYGIWSPLQNKYIPLWQSAVNRLMYDNVFSGRINKVTDTKLYDRVLSKFGREYLWFAFKARYERTLQKMYERMLIYVGSKTLQDEFKYNFPKLFIKSDLSKYALYHALLRTCSYYQLMNCSALFRNSGVSFFDVESWREFYMLRHDSQRLKHFHMLMKDVPFPYDSELKVFETFDFFYSRLCRYLEAQNLYEYARRGEAIVNAKRASGVYGFDETLC